MSSVTHLPKVGAKANFITADVMYSGGWKVLAYREMGTNEAYVEIASPKYGDVRRVLLSRLTNIYVHDASLAS